MRHSRARSLLARARRRRRGVRLRPERDAGRRRRGRETRAGRHPPRHRRLQRPAPVLEQRAHRRRAPSSSCSIASNPPPPERARDTAGQLRRRPGRRALRERAARDAARARTARRPTVHATPFTATAPFTIAPLAGGTYVIQAFYDYTGDFLPTFKFRNLPEQGDIGGGDIDTVDALKADQREQPELPAALLARRRGHSAAAARRVPDRRDPRLHDPAVRASSPTTSPSPSAPRSPIARPYFYPAGITVSFDPSSGPLRRGGPVLGAAPTNLDGHRRSTRDRPELRPGPDDAAGHRSARGARRTRWTSRA